MIPAITVDQMREVDRLMIEEFDIPLLSMMEKAGNALAELAVELYSPKSVTILVGKGNNGGGGLVAARYLHDAGVSVNVIIVSEDIKQVPLHQLSRLRQLGVSVIEEIDKAPDLFIDALLGYSATGAPRGRTAEIIEKAGSSRKPVLCLDIPSGMDPNTGEWHSLSFKDADVMTLALPKVHLQDNPHIKKLYLADIGVPLELYGRMGISVDDPFKGKRFVHLDA